MNAPKCMVSKYSKGDFFGVSECEFFAESGRNKACFIMLKNPTLEHQKVASDKKCTGSKIYGLKNIPPRKYSIENENGTKIWVQNYTSWKMCQLENIPVRNVPAHKCIASARSHSNAPKSRL